MIERTIIKKLRHATQQFPVVALIGPRQSGKTTLVKHFFPQYKYVSLEDIELRDFAQNDPRGFLATYHSGVILDEVQRVPDLFSYIQTIVDRNQQPGEYILTGSQNFLLHEKNSQSLAGRVYISKLLPFSLGELKSAGYSLSEYEDFLFKGFFPRIYDKSIAPTDWYPNYIQTYVERDVRLIKNITDLNAFQRFLKMCAARVGQLLNLSSLAMDCGITHNTAKAWLSVLESSFVIFLLQPHFKNFNRRLIKSPKLYFIDPGLVCSLLGIQNQAQLTTHYLKGGLFELFVVTELLKQRFNAGLQPNLYFWRDKAGNEIDCLIEMADKLIPVELKSGKTVVNDYFKGIKYWNGISGGLAENSYVIYGGLEQQKRSYSNVISWRNLVNFSVG